MKTDQLSNTEKLLKLMKENPDREIVFLYPEEGSDSYFTFGEPSTVKLDEYVETSDGRAWLSEDADEELLDNTVDSVDDELFHERNYPLTDEQYEKVEKEASNRIKKMDWKKVIVVYIQPK